MLTALLVASLSAVTIISGAARSVRAAAPVPASSRSVTVHVTLNRVGPPVAPGFVGFSIEYQAIEPYIGSDPHAINPVLVQLIRDVTPDQSPVLRIGGNSADQTWSPLPGVQASPGIEYTLKRSWLAELRALATETGGRLILDLNLKLDSPAEVSAEAHAFQTGIGRKLIDAFEIGNEPELYPITPYYYTEPGNVPVYPRPATYTLPDYIQEMSSLSKLVHGTALAGPATGTFIWMSRLKQLLAAEPALKIITYHSYPLIKCFTQPGDAKYPTIPNLLERSSSRDLLQGAGRFIQFAHRHGATFRVDELNSVACKGQAGVSDTFASALWMTDTLFAMARSGVDGVNIHTLPEANYHPFTFERFHGRWLAEVKPEYYGILLFTEAAPPGSRLLAVTTTPDPDIRARATLTPAGQFNVVLINDSLTTSKVVRIAPPAGVARSALIERLQAPSAAATGGVTLAGQTFGAQTGTGTLKGQFRPGHVEPAHGQYVVQLPASSAALVSFPPTSPTKTKGP